MASFAAFYRSRGQIVDHYFNEVEKVQGLREKEYKAAITIQVAWRRYKLEKRRKERNEKAVIIQKTWRMFRDMMEVRCIKAEQETKKRMEFFNNAATKIQKVWRGYYERKHIFDFKKQQEFLKEVNQKNLEMEKMLEQHFAKTDEAQKVAEENAAAQKEVKKALHTHYLVSTSAIPSIFQPPAFTKDAEAMPGIEQFIRTVNKGKIVKPKVAKQ